MQNSRQELYDFLKRVQNDLVDWNNLNLSLIRPTDESMTNEIKRISKSILIVIAAQNQMNNWRKFLKFGSFQTLVGSIHALTRTVNSKNMKILKKRSIKFETSNFQR